MGLNLGDFYYLIILISEVFALFFRIKMGAIIMKQVNIIEGNLFKKTAGFMVILWVCLLAVFAFPKASSAKFLQTFLCRVGGKDLSLTDKSLMAKYDVILLQRFHYNDIEGDTWGAVKAINPNVELFLYQLGRESQDNDDFRSAGGLNNLGRWNISRGAWRAGR